MPRQVMQQVSKYIVLSLHILFWLSAYGVVFSLTDEQYPRNAAVWITVIAGFYINVYWLVPKYLDAKRSWFSYVLLTSLVLAGVTLVEFVLDHIYELPPVYIDGRTPGTWLESAILFCAMIFIKVMIVVPLSFLFKFGRDLIVLKKVTVFAEISVHLLIAGMLYMISMMTRPYWAPEHEPLLFLFKAGYKFFILAAQLSLFYLNAFWLMPKVLATKRYVAYFVMLTLLFTVTIIIEWSVYHLPVFSTAQTSASMFTINRDVFFKLAILLASVLYRFSIDWFRHDGLRKKLESEKLSAELKFLQFQVHPHFLFNTLNNIYSLAMLENSAGTANSIGKLAGMMRYMLDECQKNHVSLSKELEYLQQYIELQKLRMNEKCDIRVHFDGDGNAYQLKIVPMILIPFIENAFKHGISVTDPSFVELKMIQYGNKFYFYLNNSIHRRRGDINSTGVGMANVMRRLTISYPEQHTLITGEKGEAYNVQLFLTLEPL